MKKKKPPVALVLSCEHGGNRVPAAYRSLFRGKKAILESHRGWDPGALDLARAIARATGAPLVATTTTRLLIECNRSIGHPQLFSEISRTLSREERTRLLDRHYHPHRGAVEAVIRSSLRTHDRVIHVGVHTFAPSLNGRRRTADVGILYDPDRNPEAHFADVWLHALHWEAPDLHVKMNYPYKGSSDGLTTSLREKLVARRYLGIELEVNQALLGRPARRYSDVPNRIARSLALLIARPDD